MLPVVTTVDPDLTAPDVVAFLEAHLTQMREVSPPESVHALDLDGLRDPAVTFFTVRTAPGTDRPGVLVGTAALKRLDGDRPGHVELKSMRTDPTRVRSGIATGLLTHLLATARADGHTRMSLETGAEPFFAPARALYARHGFVACAPFGAYRADPHSVFLTREL